LAALALWEASVPFSSPFGVIDGRQASRGRRRGVLDVGLFARISMRQIFASSRRIASR
jgi:hypothetical protein